MYGGYNVGVYVLDSICSRNYGSTKFKGLVARSFKWDDWDRACNGEVGSKYNKVWRDATFSSTNNEFPGLWDECDQTDPFEKRSVSMLPTKMKSQYTTMRAPGNAFTSYTYDKATFTGQQISNNYLELLLIKSTSTAKPQWIASRFQNAGTASTETKMSWGLYYMNYTSYYDSASKATWHSRGMMSANFITGTSEYNNSMHIRPVVEFDLKNFVLEEAPSSSQHDFLISAQ